MAQNFILKISLRIIYFPNFTQNGMMGGGGTGGIYDSRNFEQILLKMAWIKNTFYLRSIPLKKY
jgi:hypothetical protein